MIECCDFFAYWKNEIKQSFTMDQIIDACTLSKHEKDFYKYDSYICQKRYTHMGNPTQNPSA